jgi:hypothetical protein
MASSQGATRTYRYDSNVRNRFRNRGMSKTSKNNLNYQYIHVSPRFTANAVSKSSVGIANLPKIDNQPNI